MERCVSGGLDGISISTTSYPIVDNRTRRQEKADAIGLFLDERIGLGVALILTVFCRENEEVSRG
jgi:hypothetical protein